MLSLLAGCASGGARLADGEKTLDPYAAFLQGDIRLSCGLPCAGADGTSRQKYSRLYQNAVWKDLAIEILKIGFEADRNYYYLGLSAEGLGYRDAARTYYKLSLSSRFKCNGAFNVCDGLDIPNLARKHIYEINQRIAKEAMERAAEERAAKLEAERTARAEAESMIRDAEIRKQTQELTKKSATPSKPAKTNPPTKNVVTGNPLDDKKVKTTKESTQNTPQNKSPEKAKSSLDL